MIEPNTDININTVTSPQASELNTSLNLTQEIDRVIKDLLANLSVKSQNLEIEVQIELSKLLNILRRIKRLVSSSKFQKNKQLQSEVEILVIKPLQVTFGWMLSELSAVLRHRSSVES